MLQGSFPEYTEEIKSSPFPSCNLMLQSANVKRQGEAKDKKDRSNIKALQPKGS